MSGYDRQEKEREDKYPALAAGYLTCAGDPGQGQGILGLGAGHVPGRLDAGLPELGHMSGRLDAGAAGT